MAITHSLPLSEWYKEDTSQWTLDYPPFFAWFEFLLSQIAVLVEPEMLQISASPYASSSTVMFQRSTVIATDLLYICSSFLISRRSKAPQLIFSLLCFNAGLFLVDSVHFQYNSLLFALLLLSLNLTIEGKIICGFASFIVLLHFKHLFLSYIFGVYLWPKRYDLAMFISYTSLGPFVCLGQGKLLLARLFPFKRGLTHAYWAPNFWALYNFVDYCLYAIGTHRGFIPRLVAWKPSRASFIKVVTACAFSAFLFGWHVHEKAVLTIIIPLSLLAIEDERYARIFLIASVLGHYSLFPLLFKPMEIFVKYSVLILSYAFSYSALKSSFRRSINKPFYFLSRFDLMCLAGVVPVEIFYVVTSVFPRFSPFPFLPLMATSVYCAIGLCYCFVLYCWAFFSDVFWPR
ncbi:Putative dolichyl pyrophosphate Glc1Man9GlcNAc2 a lpha-1,3-glucosyltransferase isoform a [Trichuris trichiura]|uniref:Alpha-1,3-glucosyltransferase n=1 Tax=Trichuris trichiura TaxID=36087 RepID=A0A077YZQ4_TRITR|nr:Putative dolichyl pyrophosphate Glc1Man9GlcNAc2 a lpha-1,3-glucosyltransferase isoform a [Trichuris trichiura]